MNESFGFHEFVVNQHCFEYIEIEKPIPILFSYMKSVNDTVAFGKTESY